MRRLGRWIMIVRSIKAILMYAFCTESFSLDSLLTNFKGEIDKHISGK